MILNDAGKMIQTAWDEIPSHYIGIEIDAFIIMPNHIHGIIIIVGAGPRACPTQEKLAQNGQAQRPAPTLSLPEVIHRFKTIITKLYADGVKGKGWPRFPGKLLQRNYYEHIIRNDNELKQVREYISNNPLKWDADRENPNAKNAPLNREEPWKASPNTPEQ